MRGEKLGARSEEAVTHFLIEYRNSNVRHLLSHYQQMPPPWQHLNCYHKDSEGKMQEQEQDTRTRDRRRRRDGRGSRGRGRRKE